MVLARVALVAGLALPLPALAQDGAPLSAIDWLSASVGAPRAAATPPPPDEPPVTAGAATPDIVVTSLDAGTAPLGPLDPAEAGLPASLWQGSDPATLVDLVRTTPPRSVPAVEDLTVRLMLARASAPPGGEALDLARVDRLLDMGDLAAAEALLRSGDLLDPEWFRRFFDVTLLRGTEDEACGMLREHPTLAPTLEARVFCLARNGDWPAAALTLNTARALGDVAPDEDALLTHFLDPEAEPAALPADDLRPSPLTYRIREAVGDLLPTASLPLAFSHADLRGVVAWRAQIEAAERLARRGALAPETLQAIYMARTPAASGGVWDRAAAIQRLDAALAGDDDGEASEALDDAWAVMGEAGLQGPLGALYGPTVAARPLEGRAAVEAGLLSGAYAQAAARLGPADAALRAVALGGAFDGQAPDGTTAAVLAGLADGAPMSDAMAGLVAGGQVGEATLRASAALAQGLDGDHASLAGALATLRALGLDDAARRAGLEAILLGQGG